MFEKSFCNKIFVLSFLPCLRNTFWQKNQLVSYSVESDQSTFMKQFHTKWISVMMRSTLIVLLLFIWLCCNFCLVICRIRHQEELLGQFPMIRWSTTIFLIVMLLLTCAILFVPLNQSVIFLVTFLQELQQNRLNLSKYFTGESSPETVFNLKANHKFTVKSIILKFLKCTLFKIV